MGWGGLPRGPARHAELVGAELEDVGRLLTLAGWSVLTRPWVIGEETSGFLKDAYKFARWEPQGTETGGWLEGWNREQMWGWRGGLGKASGDGTRERWGLGGKLACVSLCRFLASLPISS